MDVIPAKAGISPLLKRPVTMSGGVFLFTQNYSCILFAELIMSSHV